MVDLKHPEKKKTGRPARDWDALFTEWLKSGLPRKEFLRLKKIDWRSGAACRNTQHWDKAIEETLEHVTNMKHQANGNKKVAAVVDVLTGVATDENPKLRGTGAGTSWQLVQQWRNNQAAQDWKITDQVRVHISLLLKGGLQKTATGEWVSTLKPSDVRMLALAASDVQRVQRLALGLSTENIGIDGQLETHVEGSAPSESGEAQKNIFVVQLSKAGKFVTARPRRVS